MFKEPPKDLDKPPASPEVEKEAQRLGLDTTTAVKEVARAVVPISDTPDEAYQRDTKQQVAGVWHLYQPADLYGYTLKSRILAPDRLFTYDDGTVMMPSAKWAGRWRVEDRPVVQGNKVAEKLQTFRMQLRHPRTPNRRLVYNGVIALSATAVVSAFSDLCKIRSAAAVGVVWELRRPGEGSGESDSNGSGEPKMVGEFTAYRLLNSDYAYQLPHFSETIRSFMPENIYRIADPNKAPTEEALRGGPPNTVLCPSNDELPLVREMLDQLREMPVESLVDWDDHLVDFDGLQATSIVE
ncbi:unnamed protein product [Vitrella brassicaformis CCMP3155]|uniref:Uncharacterized protein n=2 Tax=Vitrella brassicaformis TaxID=1169539 RepID=A0A0G4FL21_VITBC|nr:unnamed protein product [Vitrella brassicaformis CCMP3155]|eukprot:CEM14597.1 unnamed protein product [Vitrella brassicaformis CCMP3155]